MEDYRDIARSMIISQMGEPRFHEICRQFGLGREEIGLMDRLWAEWKPDYSFDDVVAICERYKDCANIGRVLQAWQLISKEAALTATARREANTKQ